MPSTDYAVEFSAAADRQFGALPRPVQTRVYARAAALATDPRPSGCSKLAGEASTYRVRVGDYRIIYEVHDAEARILVLAIGAREHVYSRRR